jgi:hypothetical protein
MATTTERETFSKATTTRAQVDDERQERLRRGAVSSDISDDPDNWILTTVWPVEQ